MKRGIAGRRTYPRRQARSVRQFWGRFPMRRTQNQFHRDRAHFVVFRAFGFLKAVILSGAKDLLSRRTKRKQVLRCAQDDSSTKATDSPDDSWKKSNSPDEPTRLSRLTVLWALSAFLFALLSCSQPSDPKTLVMIIESSPTNLDPRVG